MTAIDHSQTSYDDQEKGEGVAFSGVDFDLSKPLSRSDLQLFNQAVGSPTLMEIPEWWAKNAAARLVQDFQESTSKRQRQSITRSMMILCAHNLELAKYAAVMLRERDERDQTPVSAPTAPALPAPENSPSERRKLLLDPAEAMRQITADPALSRLADHLNEEAARAKAAQSS